MGTDDASGALKARETHGGEVGCGRALTVECVGCRAQHCRTIEEYGQVSAVILFPNLNIKQRCTRDPPAHRATQTESAAEKDHPCKPIHKGKEEGEQVDSSTKYVYCNNGLH